MAPVPDMEVITILKMALISTSTGQIESDFTVKSVNSGLSISDNEDGMDYRHYADLFDVVQHGVTEGTKNLVKGCSC